MRVVILLLLVLLLSKCFAQQPTINEVYPNYEGNLSVSIIPENNGFLLFGIGYVEESLGHGGVKVVKTDTLGDFVWRTVYTDSFWDYSPGYYGSSQKLKDGSGYITFGYRINRLYHAKGLILKHDLIGNIVWSKLIGFAGTNIFQDGMELSNGDFIMVGQSKSPSQVWLVKTDSTGNVLWEKFYGGSKNESAISIVRTKDEGFMLFGQTESIGSGMKDAYLIKVDSVGNLIWEKAYGTYWSEYSVQGITSASGGYYFWGSAQDDDAVTQFPTYEKSSYITKIDKNGNVLWSKTLFQDYSKFIEIAEVKETNDGKSLLLVGFKDIPYTDLMAGWIAKLDSSGNILWERFHLNPNNNDLGARLFNFEVLDDGRIACTGAGDTPGSIYLNQENYWLLVVDSFGCLIPGCDTVTSVNSVLVDYKKIYPYPNPATNSVTFNIDNNQVGAVINFYDLHGNEVLQYQLDAERTTIQLDLPNGMYFYLINEINGTTQKGKLIVIRN